MYRRRREVQVWPVVADLMTVLAVVSLVLALTAEEATTEPRPVEVPGNSRDLANARAIREAREIIQRIGAAVEMPIGADGSLNFRDELVIFKTNEVIPNPTEGGRKILKAVCQGLTKAFVEADLEDLSLEIGGHTDVTSCDQGKEECNWYFASARAGRFADWLKQDDHCPGIEMLKLKPVGYAATQPTLDSVTRKLSAQRRISLRLIPDYDFLVADGQPAPP